MTRKQFDYVPTEIEPKWQEKWVKAKLYDVENDSTKPKKFVLEMFPYPSGRIHMGHVRNYSIGDVMARYFRMQGYNVLHPMGWDAFGLPAENAAMQNHVHPKKWTYENIANMKLQFGKLAMSFDWRREVTTCDEDYYRWEQVMFLRMLKEGLAYREKRKLNWCPSCETVLANEEVVDTRCWRCDTIVVQKEMDQWFLRITKYAEELLSGIDNLTQWPEHIKTMQRNWIGKSVGAEIDFRLENKTRTKIRVFTTRPDTIYGVSAILISPKHKLAGKLNQTPKIPADVQDTETTEKVGFFTGSFAIHPLTQEKIPIWLANFVLTDYGTGALMAVPAHDERDFEFATKYNLPIKKVVVGGELPFTESGISISSPLINGLKTAEAKQKITEILIEKKIGEAKTNFRLRDWGISRQRYWGTPIPIIHCPDDGIVPVPEKDLPIKLPEKVEFKKTGGSPLAQSPEFLNVKCPKCGGDALREPDTMSTFVESSWYYSRFTSVKHGNEPVNKKACDYWLPIDHYIGGVEHATGHLLYFRFFHKLMRDWGWLSGDEPAKQLISQGMVYKDGAKMSKSKGNVVDPDELINRLGADTARLFVLFAGPIEKDLEWSDQSVEGCHRFLGRVYRLVMNSIQELTKIKAEDRLAQDDSEAKKLQHLMHKTIRNVTVDIEKDFHYNTAISFLMEFVNGLYTIDLATASEDLKALYKKCLENLVLMLSPFAPHLGDELWSEMGHKEFTLNTNWPKYNEELAKSSEKEIVFQINGKIKDRAICRDGTPDEELKELAFSNKKIQEAMAGKSPKRVIVVSNKLVNIVV